MSLRRFDTKPSEFLFVGIILNSSEDDPDLSQPFLQRVKPFLSLYQSFVKLQPDTCAITRSTKVQLYSFDDQANKSATGV